MSLEQWFYALSITFFFSFWIIIAVAMVLLYRLYQGVKDMKQTLTSRPVAWLASSAPFMTIVLPVLTKLWSGWRSRKRV
jgi:predicted PurR-regulated permease PerM